MFYLSVKQLRYSTFVVSNFSDTKGVRKIYKVRRFFQVCNYTPVEPNPPDPRDVVDNSDSDTITT